MTEEKKNEDFRENSKQVLIRLKNKRDELKTMLRAVDDSLINLGYLQESTESEERRRQPSYIQGIQSGLRVKESLSFRGKEKAAEFFDYLDEENRGLLFLPDFRAMHTRAVSGYLHDPVFMHKEPWALYLSDLGIPLIDGGVTKEGFVKYREAIEKYQPLAKEIVAHQLSLLPKHLDLWKQLKILIQEIFEHRAMLLYQEKAAAAIKGSSSNQGGLAASVADIPEGLLTMEDIQFILGNLGMIYWKSEFGKHRIPRAVKDRMMDELMRLHLKHHFASSPTRFSSMLRQGRIKKVDPIISVKDFTYLKPSLLIAWVFADPPASKLSKFNQSLIEWKYKYFRFLRKTDDFFRHGFDVLTHLRSRMVYRDFPSVKHLEGNFKERSMLNFQFFLGSDVTANNNNNNTSGNNNQNPSESSEDNRKSNGESSSNSSEGFDGLGITMKLSRLDQPEALLTRYGLPRESGTVFSIEFFLRSPESLLDGKNETTTTHQSRQATPGPSSTASSASSSSSTSSLWWKEKIEGALEACRHFSRLHWEGEMKKNPQFRGVFWSLGSHEGDGAPVIRLSIVYKRLVSLDTWFQQVYLPYTFTEFIPDFHVEINSNLSLEDLLTSAHASLDHSLLVQARVRISYRRDLLIQLLKRTILAMKASFPKRFLEGGSMDDLGPPPGLSKAATSTTSLFQANLNSRPPTSQRPKTTTSNKPSTAPSTARTGTATASATAKSSSGESMDGDATDKREREKWIYFQSVFPEIVKLCQNFIFWLEGKNVTSLDYSIKSLSEFLERLGHLHPWIRRYFPPKVGKAPGLLKQLYDDFTRFFYQEMHQNFVDCQEFLERKYQEEEKERLRVLMMSKQDQLKEEASKTESLLRSKLTSLGLGSSTMKMEDLVENLPETPASYVKQEEEIDWQHGVRGYLAWEKLKEVAMGIHAMEVISGETKLLISLQGWDILEFLPELPSLQQVKDDIEQRKRNRNPKKKSS